MVRARAGGCPAHPPRAGSPPRAGRVPGWRRGPAGAISDFPAGKCRAAGWKFLCAKSHHFARYIGSPALTPLPPPLARFPRGEIDGPSAVKYAGQWSCAALPRPDFPAGKSPPRPAPARPGRRREALPRRRRSDTEGPTHPHRDFPAGKSRGAAFATPLPAAAARRPRDRPNPISPRGNHRPLNQHRPPARQNPLPERHRRACATAQPDFPAGKSLRPPHPGNDKGRFPRGETGPSTVSRPPAGFPRGEISPRPAPGRRPRWPIPAARGRAWKNPSRPAVPSCPAWRCSARPGPPAPTG